jgi:hypothetical protein
LPEASFVDLTVGPQEGPTLFFRASTLRVRLPCARLVSGFIGLRCFQVVVATTHEPIRDAEGQREAGERGDRRGGNFVRVCDNDFSGQGELGDQDDDLALHDPPIAADHILQRVIELQGDQQGHDLTEHPLEHSMLERIESSEHQGADDADDEAVQRHQDDHVNHQRQQEGDRRFKPLVDREHRPLAADSDPVAGQLFHHGWRPLIAHRAGSRPA